MLLADPDIKDGKEMTALSKSHGDLNSMTSPPQTPLNKVFMARFEQEHEGMVSNFQKKA